MAEAEAGVMIVEIEVVSLRGNTGIDEMPEDRLHFVMTKFEIDGGMNRTEIGGDHHLKEEVARRITPLVILETHRQALIWSVLDEAHEMAHCPAAHHPLRINLSLGDMAGRGVPVDVDEVVITMIITEFQVVVGLLIRVGVVELNHLRHHLHRFLLLARHQAIFKSLPTIQPALLQLRQTIHRVLSLA